MIRGKHSSESLAIVLNKFIDIYVLCSKYQNPETIHHIKPDKIISKCKACGNVFQIKISHKSLNYITKSEAHKKQVINKNITNLPETNDEWSVNTSADAVAIRKQTLSPELSNSSKIKKVFFTLFNDGDIRSNFYVKIEQIKSLINNDKSMLLLLRCIENFMLENEKCLTDIVHFINGFYEKQL